MTAPHAALLRLASGEPMGSIGDEGELLRSASEHRMGSLVLAAAGSGDVRLSTDSAMTLGMWDLAERRLHTSFWDAIRQVEDRLGPLGVEVAVLKGVATEARWYDEMGQRVCTDVDLLLPPSSLPAVSRVLDALEPGRSHHPSIDALAASGLLQHVDVRVGPTQVDVHFDPLKLGLPTRQLDEVWASTEALSTPNGTIRVLRPEIELVLLLLHLNKDRFAYLGPFMDVGRILDRASLDWAYLRHFVAVEGLEVPVWASLGIVADVVDIPVETHAPSGFKATTWRRLWGRQSILGGHEARQKAPSIQRMLPFHATGRNREVLREARRQLFPPRALIEVAGMIGPGDSYLRYVTIGRFARRPSPE